MIAKYIACVGSRETPPDVLAWMETTAAELVRHGCAIVSGNAEGADQAWARGANSVDPNRVLLCLPWIGYQQQAVVEGNIAVALDNLGRDQYNGYMDIAARLHPSWGYLNGAAHRLHARNIAIVECASAVIGYLNPLKKGGGGTGMAFRAARHYGVPAWNVANADVRETVIGLCLKAAA